MWTSDFGVDEMIAVPRKRQRPVQPSSKIKNLVKQRMPSLVPSVDELVTHPRKIEEVKNWLKNSGNADVLLLTGPPGSAKTTTLRAVAQDLKIIISEWVNPPDLINIQADDRDFFDGDVIERVEYSHSKQLDKFENFVWRCSRYKPLFGNSGKTILLIEDFPNHFIWKPSLFHDFLEKFKKFGRSPIVFICTEDEKFNFLNDLFPNAIRSKYNVHNIKFNPVSCTAMNRILKKQIGINTGKETVDKLVVSSNGDIRTALSSLEFLLLENEPIEFRPKRKKLKMDTPKPLVVPKKDISADFFHIIGRILYPKRKETPDPDGRMFVHDVLHIADHLKYASINILHENFIDTFSNLNEVTDACDIFSQCDLFERCEHDVKDYSSLIAVIGVMSAKKQMKSGLFKPLGKSKWSTTKGNNVIDRPTNDLSSRKFIMDVRPYLNIIKNNESDYYRKNVPNSRCLNVGESSEMDNELVIEEFSD